MPSILRHLFLLALALTFAPAQGQIAQTKNDFEDRCSRITAAVESELGSELLPIT